MASRQLAHLQLVPAPAPISLKFSSWPASNVSHCHLWPGHLPACTSSTGGSSYICTSSYIIKVFQLARPSHLAHILMTILQNLKLTVSHTYSLDGPGVILPCKDANIVNRKNWSWLASDKTGGISLSWSHPFPILSHCLIKLLSIVSRSVDRNVKRKKKRILLPPKWVSWAQLEIS